MAQSHLQDKKMNKKMTFWSIVLLTINSVIGTGIFLSPGGVAKQTGSYEFLTEHGIFCEDVHNLSGSSRSDVDKVLDLIIDRRFNMVINTPTKANDDQRSGFKLRRAAIEYGTKMFTSLDTLSNYLEALVNNEDKKDFEVYNLGE